MESATFIADLDATLPVGASDLVSEGDDILRLIKTVLQNTISGFPDAVIMSGVEAQGATVNDYVVTTTPAQTQYSTKSLIVFLPTHTNDSAVTLALSGLSAKNLKAIDDSALAASSIVSGTPVMAIYNGTNYRLMTVGAVYAALASPTFTGTPAAPTAAPGTSTTQIATTAFVAALGALKANIASPTFTGTPAGPTAAPGTSTTQLATTAFVMALAAAITASELAAAASASAASSSASGASSSASSASTSASTATTQAGIATTKASEASVSAAAALVSENAAAASAASAAATANAFIGTSTTSWTPAVESKAFTTQAGELYTAGIYVTIVSAGTPSAYGWGQVTSYAGTTLTVDVQLASGSGAHTDWNISLAGVRGATGATGATGPESFPPAAAGGTVDAITATVSGITPSDGQACRITSAGANTSTTPSFSPNGATARTIKMQGGVALAAGSIGPSGFVMLLEYHSSGTYWELLNPIPATASAPVGASIFTNQYSGGM